MTVSLVAVFVPILLDGGPGRPAVPRIFHDDHRAIVISLVVSLTTTPMMCALLLRTERGRPHGRLYLASEAVFEAVLNFYRRTLTIALRHPRSVMLTLAAVLGLNFYLYAVVPKGFVPQQDTDC